MILVNESCQILKIIGEKIRKERTKQGISQSQLGFESGLTREFINKIEAGKLNISICNLLKISNSLNLKLQDLLNTDFDNI